MELGGIPIPIPFICNHQQTGLVCTNTSVQRAQFSSWTSMVLHNSSMQTFVDTAHGQSLHADVVFPSANEHDLV